MGQAPPIMRTIPQHFFDRVNRPRNVRLTCLFVSSNHGITDMILLETKRMGELWRVTKDGVLVGKYRSGAEAEHATIRIAVAACNAGFWVRALYFKDEASPPREQFHHPRH